jgi:hypothetical protein
MNTTLILAAISGRSIVTAVVWVVVAGIIWWLLNWLLDYCKVPEPFNRVGKVILAILAVLVLINAILIVVGRPFITW